MGRKRGRGMGRVQIYTNLFQEGGGGQVNSKLILNTFVREKYDMYVKLYKPITANSSLFGTIDGRLAKSKLLAIIETKKGGCLL